MKELKTQKREDVFGEKEPLGSSEHHSLKLEA